MVVLTTSNEGGAGRTFKPCMTTKESRRSRDETTLKLRKERKHNQMMKRRCSARSQDNDNAASTNAGATTSTTTTNNNINEKSEPLIGSAEDDTLLTILEIVQVLEQREADPYSVPHQQLYEEIKKIRKVLSEVKNPPIVEIIQSRIVTYIAQLLSQEVPNPPSPDIVFEAAWVLTNIAATKYAYVVADCGAIPELTKLLIHDNPSVREQSAWCIGNLAADSSSQRDALLKVPGLVDGMIRNLREPFNEELLKNVAWTVSNLCRGKPQPAFEDVRPFVDALVHVLECCELSNLKADVRVDAVWALSYINDGCNDESIDALIQRGAVPTLMKLVMDFPDDRTLMIATVRALGNFIAGTDSQTDAVLNAGFLKWSMDLLQHRSKAIQKDTCWILSNVAAGSKQQIDQLFDTVADYGIMKKLVYMAGNTNWEIRKEAIYAVCNAITNGSDEHAKILVNMNIINVFSRQLANWDDARVLLAILEAIEKLLLVSQRYGLEYDIILEETQGLDRLEDLQNHRNVNVYDSVINIIVKYFKDNDEDDVDQNVAPIAHEEEFSFGVAQLPSKQLFASPDQNTNNEATFNFHFGGSLSSNIVQV